MSDLTNNSSEFMSIDLVNFDGQLKRLAIDFDWNVELDTEVIDIDINAAFCLAALMSQKDRLLGFPERETALLNIFDDTTNKGMKPSEIVSKENRKISKGNVKSSEYELIKRIYPLYLYLFQIGYVGAKRLMLCTNVQTDSGGINVIERFFADTKDEQVIEFHKANFLKEYTARERFAKSMSSALVLKDYKLEESEEVKVQIKKPKKYKANSIQLSPIISIQQLEVKPQINYPQEIKPKPKNLSKAPVFVPSDAVQGIRDKYTDVKEYDSQLIGFVEALSQDETLTRDSLIKSDLLVGLKPNPADIDRILLECSRRGFIKKVFVDKPKKTDEIAFKRFNKN